MKRLRLLDNKNDLLVTIIISPYKKKTLLNHHLVSVCFGLFFSSSLIIWIDHSWLQLYVGPLTVVSIITEWVCQY